MDEKESDEGEDSSIDYEFLNKYIRDDSDENSKNQESFSEKFKIKKLGGPTEVFGSIGEGESYSQYSQNTDNGGGNSNNGNNNFKRRYNSGNTNEDEENDEKIKASSKVEFTSKPISEAKKEFLEELEDESLSVDICSQVNKDWGK